MAILTQGTFRIIIQSSNRDIVDPSSSLFRKAKWKVNIPSGCSHFTIFLDMANTSQLANMEVAMQCLSWACPPSKGSMITSCQPAQTFVLQRSSLKMLLVLSRVLRPYLKEGFPFTLVVRGNLEQKLPFSSLEKTLEICVPKISPVWNTCLVSCVSCLSCNY